MLQLDELQVAYDPNPTEYSDSTIQDPNVVFYWGLAPGRSNYLDLNVVQEDFRKNLSTGYKGGLPGKITITVIQASQLPKNMQIVDTPHVIPNSSQMVPVQLNNVYVGYFAPTQPSFGIMS